eukprot:m.206079 g.206079  ORF g.206079 m.206079 type:complete len:348 (-) comp15794_c1_seq6:5369-6412(-)
MTDQSQDGKGGKSSNTMIKVPTPLIVNPNAPSIKNKALSLKTLPSGKSAKLMAKKILMPLEGEQQILKLAPKDLISHIATIRRAVKGVLLPSSENPTEAIVAACRMVGINPQAQEYMSLRTSGQTVLHLSEKGKTNTNFGINKRKLHNDTLWASTVRERSQELVQGFETRSQHEHRKARKLMSETPAKINSIEDIINKISSHFPAITPRKSLGNELELKLAGVFKAVIGLCQTQDGLWCIERVHVFSLDETINFSDLDCGSKYDVFKNVSECCRAAATFFLKHEQLSYPFGFLEWLNGYNTLFSEACIFCNRILNNENGSLLPPTHRKLSSTQLFTGRAYHKHCKPC